MKTKGKLIDKNETPKTKLLLEVWKGRMGPTVQTTKQYRLATLQYSSKDCLQGLTYLCLQSSKFKKDTNQTGEKKKKSKISFHLKHQKKKKRAILLRILGCLQTQHSNVFIRSLFWEVNEVIFLESNRILFSWDSPTERWPVP